MEALSGATVYECFQLEDWRGGSATTGLIDNAEGIFPMSQYYVQNIEVPLRLRAGAIEYTHMSVNIGGVGIQDGTVPFLGNSTGFMFYLQTGYVEKDYLEGTGRTEFTAAGNFAINSVTMTIKLSVIGTKDINSAKYNLPINSGMTVIMNSGNMTIDQSVAMHPGAKIIVNKDATCVLKNKKSMFLYADNNWDTYVYDAAIGGNARYAKLNYAPGGTGTSGYTDDATIVINGTVDAREGYVYTTKDIVPITSEGTGVVIVNALAERKTYQVVQGANSETSDKRAIDVVPAHLTNGDGTTVDTGLHPEVDITYTYDADNKLWKCSAAVP